MTLTTGIALALQVAAFAVLAVLIVHGVRRWREDAAEDARTAELERQAAAFADRLKRDRARKAARARLDAYHNRTKDDNGAA